MTGKGHIVSGTTILADAIFACILAGSGTAPAFAVPAADAASRAMNPLHGGITVPGALMAAACVACYYIRVLLPDIDKAGSTISKLVHFHIPVNHRGITHSLWAMVPAAVTASLTAGYARMTFLWFLAGMLAHNLVDGLSVAGWVPFYPLGSWRTYRDTMTRRRHHHGWYSSNVPGSEDAMNGFLIVVSVVSACFWAYLAYWPK